MVWKKEVEPLAYTTSLENPANIGYFLIYWKIKNIWKSHGSDKWFRLTDMAVIAVEGPCSFPNSSFGICSGVMNVVTKLWKKNPQFLHNKQFMLSSETTLVKSANYCRVTGCRYCSTLWSMFLLSHIPQCTLFCLGSLQYILQITSKLFHQLW